MRFTETISIPETASIDEEAGVIRGVKVIGTRSRNRRIYPREVLQKAAPLYEGAMVNANHREPGKGNVPRTIEDRFGSLSGISYREGQSPGLYGDLHYLKAHPMAGRVVEASRRHDLRNVFGLSHDADGEGRTTNDGFLVESITRVNSVDLVSDPATNRSLFEDVRLRRIRLSELVGSMPADSKAKQLMQQQMDQKVLDPETEVEADPEQDPMATADQAPEQAVDDAFRAEVVKAFDDEALDHEGRVARIRDILKAHDEVKDAMAQTANNDPAKGKGAEAGTPPANGQPPAGKQPEGKQQQSVGEAFSGGDGAPTLASLQEQLRQMQAKDECRDLLEAAGRKATPQLLKALIAMPTLEDRKAFLEELGTVQVQESNSQGGGNDRKPKPRTTGSNAATDADKAKEIPKGKALRESLMIDDGLLELEEALS